MVSGLDATPFMLACRRQPAPHTPIWLMRQAGRYMPEYRALRAKHSILEIIDSPELAVEVTLQPVNAFPLDAAIIFADILPPLRAMGLTLEFVAGEGPRIGNPLRRPADVDRLAVPPAEEVLPSTIEAVRLASAELATRGVPLIGFAGAPFTLACYAIEGGGSRHFEVARSFMYEHPAAWGRLMRKLSTVSADLLVAQAKAGASALQFFDSWAGLLSASDYDRYVRPYMTAACETVARGAPGVPLITFGTGTAGILENVAACGGDVIGVDWRIPLDAAWARIGDRAIMGNLDPVLLQAPWRELRAQADEVLASAGGRPGHIFNLGHGVLQHTPPDAVRRLVEYVHERSAA
ncbi:MAG TPA: uroporphyrinogen decarboxylase [Gemmatimonadaceae bacterium]|nr:uroporphyrinogen decarboxylase [Gemmatimonadaceae bacterium]